MKLNFKSQILKLINEGSENKPFFYLAPDIIGSVNNANLDLKNNVFKIGFKTTDERDLSLNVPYKSYEKWLDNNVNNEKNKTLDFVIDFVTCSKEFEDNNENKNGNEEQDVELNEIVDEFNNIIGDGDTDDMPSNGNFHSVGKSKFDTEKAVKHTVPKSKRFYGDLGLGVISW